MDDKTIKPSKLAALVAIVLLLGIFIAFILPILIAFSRWCWSFAQ